MGSGGGREVEGGEDISQLVIDVLQSRFQGLSISSSDIDRAHRLPGPNNRVIVRFVRSGLGSVRDQLMSRRMELRGRNDLFINESLTTLLAGSTDRSWMQRRLENSTRSTAGGDTCTLKPRGLGRACA